MWIVEKMTEDFARREHITRSDECSKTAASMNAQSKLSREDLEEVQFAKV
jgi:hypothetical protein